MLTGNKHPKYKHGGCCNSHETRLYQTWCAMKKRCSNPNLPDYKYYGSKGVEVCDSWSSDYKTFRGWAYNNGYADNLTIDRIDNNSGYCPENCQFITRVENVKKQWRDLKAKNDTQ